ncbi:hypothetical protein E3P99_02311 [Wallemia hederae]|uniref:Uncharacterized protein n=1 Tax=Wallemia hederae TaxID=1540922 RepID=A0A4T0FQ18_9BASI|nr:hypothetical protein E3P99_02311 [Wallemia hederae]
MDFNDELKFKEDFLENSNKLAIHNSNLIFPSTNTLDLVTHFNPYKKNQLAISRRKAKTLLITPANENNESLNINLANSLNNSVIQLNDPILQVEASSSDVLSRSRHLSHLLAIKCQSSLLFFNCSHQFADKIYSFTHQHPIPDISFHGLNCLIIDSYDNIFKFTFNPRMKLHSSISQLRHRPYFHQSYDNRFRLIDFDPYDQQATQSCLTANSHSLYHNNFRTNSSTLILHTSSTITHLHGFISPKSASLAHGLTILTTTTHIHLFNIRCFDKSLLSIPHYRSYDRSLSVMVLDSPNDTISLLLFSSQHPLLSIYTVGGDSVFPRLLSAPYAHRLPYAPVGGYGAIEREGEEREHVYDIYLRSQGGSLTYMTLSPSQLQSPPESLSIHTDPAVWAYQVDGYFGDSLASMREYTRRDLTKQWGVLKGDADAHVQGEEEERRHGASQSTALLDYNTHGFQALLSSEMTPGGHAHTHWNYKIPTALHAPSPTFAYGDDDAARAYVERELQASYTASASRRPGEAVSGGGGGGGATADPTHTQDKSTTKESDNDTTTPTLPTSHSGGLVQELTRAASAMNIHRGQEVRPYEFGALKASGGGGGSESDSVVLNTATNLLLSEWDGDVYAYRYRDPYDSDEEGEGEGESGVQNTQTSQQTQLKHSQLPSQLQPLVSSKKPRRPPVVMSTASATPAPTIPFTQPAQPAQSQNDFAYSPDNKRQVQSQFQMQQSQPHSQSQSQQHSQQQHSQQYNPSTQVEPGKFGGRPAAPAKKKKKRMGGF